MMLMHHSRNTEQKQWGETLVLVLAGLTKIHERWEVWERR